MPIIIPQVKSGLDESRSSVIAKAMKMAGLNSSDVKKADIYKTSLDARKQDNIRFVHSVIISLGNENDEADYAQKHGLTFAENSSLEVSISDRKTDGKVIVVGFGPAGMFCALVLAENGYRPIVLERGESIDKRVKAVSGFWSGGELDEATNVQFGEGGAGTFSDGKLTTRIKDPLSRYVMKRFVEFGAPEEILTKAKPHIGTDKLRGIVKSIRQRIISLGGEIYFNTAFDDFKTMGRRITQAQAGDKFFEAAAVVLAAGHSARDTAEMLLKKGVFIEPKPFAIGARIEHRQSDVDESLYGKYADNPLLPKGEYQLSHTLRDGQAVYTFCMCPGGTVVPAASERGTVVVNGMSEFSRDGKNANSALVVAVRPEDYGSGVLDGMYFARKIEQKAYNITGSYKAPATTVSGFLNGRPHLSEKVYATYAGGVLPADFSRIFPRRVCAMMKTGLGVFSRRMKCFGDSEAMLTAPETRTSSPIRITRTEEMKSLSLENLYPCGEGAGYAGGITSSAVDGIKAAKQIMSEIAPSKK